MSENIYSDILTYMSNLLDAGFSREKVLDMGYAQALDHAAQQAGEALQHGSPYKAAEVVAWVARELKIDARTEQEYQKMKLLERDPKVIYLQNKAPSPL